MDGVIQECPVAFVAGLERQFLTRDVHLPPATVVVDLDANTVEA